MVNTRDIKGMWQGHYSYSASAEIGEIPFKARLSVADGVLTGLIIEGHNVTGLPVKAEAEGTFDGTTARWVKRYTDTSGGYTRPVEYVGMLSADGTTLSGTWTLPDDSGTFSMTRPE